MRWRGERWRDQGKKDDGDNREREMMGKGREGEGKRNTSPDVSIQVPTHAHSLGVYGAW